MKPWCSHAFLRREVDFSGFLVNTAPLRVGMGVNPLLGASVDLAFLRIQYNGCSVPYIPGSSLKGIFRNFAATLATQKNLPICPASPEDNCMKRLGKKEDEKPSIEEFYKKACLLCQIFGSPGFRGLSTFWDAYPQDEKGHIYVPKTGLRPGIRIGRRTGAVERGRFDVEYIEPGAKFRFQVRATNLPNYALGLLSRVIISMNRGEVKVGGFKSRGFGEVRVENPKFRVRGEASANRLNPLDERDSEVEVRLMEEGGWLACEGDRAWELIEKLARVWDDAKLE
jgi:CRISPR-associated RAMP protein (TIGR02581 family)